MYVCLCKGITEAQIKELGRQGHSCPKALARTMGIDEEDCCGRCLKNIEELVAIATSKIEAPNSR